MSVTSITPSKRKARGNGQVVPPAEEAPAKTKGRPRKAPTIIAPADWYLMEVGLQCYPASPLLIQRFSQKAQEAMQRRQEEGESARNKKQRQAKDFDMLYAEAMYVSPKKWAGVKCVAFRNAMISACRLVGFKMTMAKCTIFVEPDGNDKFNGVPLVRINGVPKKDIQHARNATGVIDLRVRPRWDDWSAKLRIRFDASQFRPEDIMALVTRAGEQIGVGEGRPDSKNSNGQGWGMFEVDHKKGVVVRQLPRKVIHFKYIMK